ncbi:MAG: electron transport complex subunit E [Planctomycetota bacterium]|nr:electron transport complex subunit E [Planctomycetota bacterium]
MSQTRFRSLLKELTKGFIRENPILVIMLGLCATLACSTSATDAFGMGLAFSFVMLGSNIVVAIIRRVVPSQIRIPVFITVISTFVTIVDYTLKAYFPALSQSLGVYVPLIVVNCIVMARAEAYSSKNTVMASLMDGIGMGIGFTLIITLIGTIREVIGNGTMFGHQVMPARYQPFMIFILPPGAFLVIGFLMALHRKFMITFYESHR